MESVQKQLEELGLSQNEVKIYVASLEAGPATAQQLAAKAAVVRPTAYVAIGGLTKRGLMSSHTRGKKQYFQGARPETLISIVEFEKKRVVVNEEKLKTLLPRLNALVSIVGARPDVSYYEGLEGLHTMRAVLFSSAAKELLIIGSPEKYINTVNQDSVHLHNYHLEKSAIKIRQLAIYTNKKPRVVHVKFERRYIKSDALESGEIAIFGDYVSLISYLDQPYGFLVKSQEIARVAKKLFETSWQGAKRTS